jgi:2-polyprenyl-3-methyl-5-hydroxy-6-metoxy-1,4-benzoquinol methylase
MMLLSSSVGIHLTWSSALGVLVVLNVGIAIPISFANVGTFETAVAFGLIRLGNPLQESLGVATVHHLIQVGSTLMLAGGFWLLSRPGAHKSVFRVLEVHKRRAFDYYDGVAERYEETAGRGPLRFLRDRERSAVLAFARLDDSSKSTMIDVGCGGGYYALAAKRVGLRVCAVDVAPKMIRLLQGRVDETHCSDIESLALTSTYDIVVCSGVLDFVLNPEVAFENLAALTADGGRLIVQVPRRGACAWIYRFEKKLLRIEVNQFSREWFEAQAHARGLVVAGCVHPLPTNTVLLLERATTPGL